MFDTFIVQPIFNLLVFIYALLPGHNFGLALIIFTVIVRLLLWPMVKKQLHQAKVMRRIQPELKRIKKAANGDKQKESMMMMAMYKEQGVNPFGSIGLLLLQLPILIGLYSGLHRLIEEPKEIVNFSYPFIQDMSWINHLSHNIHAFDATLFGVVDLTRAAVGPAGLYWPALLIVIGSAVIQYFTSKQLMPSDKDARKLRDILKSAGEGKQADQSEVNAAVSRSTRFLLPAMIFIFTINIASGLGLYWLVGGLVAYIQQTIVFRKDETEIEQSTQAKSSKKINGKEVIEGEIIAETSNTKKSSAKKGSVRKNKRRKK